MSLDVYLNRPGSGIFVREGGRTHEVSEEEWAHAHPDREPVRINKTVYTANITHNLCSIAEAAGIYEALWRPEEVGVTKAAELIPLLERGLDELRAEPERFRRMNPDNGWGTYEGLVEFVEDYLSACCAAPDATVRVWR